MGEPLARLEGGEGALSDAVQRLERALRGLEDVFKPAPTAPDERFAASGAGVVELQAVRRRGRELEAAGAQAALALGRAMDEVRRALDDDDAEAQALEDVFEAEMLESALESKAGLADDEQTAAAKTAPEEEPTE